MSESKRSFWASIPGLITGLAGLLTGVVGLGTLAVQQGIIGGDDKDSPATTVVTPATGTGGGTATTAEVVSFRVDPPGVKFGPAEREKAVKVLNTSTSLITLARPTFNGAEPAAFTADAGCSAALAVGGSCTVKITYRPVPLKTPTANLVLQVQGASNRVTEIPIETSLL